jgi:multicomponent Na+:H+ antiporter subunit E
MKYVATFLVLFASYLALAGFELQELLLGAVVSVALTFILAKHVNYTLDYRFPVRLLVFIFVYVPLFVFQLVLSNIDIAFRVLSPKIPLNPGFIKISTDLKGDFAKLTLANSITLTPGTLSVDIDGSDIYIHTVHVKGKTPEENRELISSKFEKVLGVVFK